MAIRTVEDIKKVCRETFEIAHYDFDFFGIEIAINKRLTKTLGRCWSCGDTVQKIEISAQLIETCTQEDIIDTIKHECAHALVVIEEGESHGHDSYFKAMCKIIGAKRDTAKGPVTRVVAPEAVYKYTINCPKCGNIGGMSRMSKNLRDIENCYCKKCHSYGLSYTQNW